MTDARRAVPSRPPLVLLALALAPFAACLPTGAPPTAPVDVVVATADAGPDAALPLSSTPPRSPGERCTARLVAGTIKMQAGCYLEERISRGVGLLSYPCSGDGAVVATFGDQRFEGGVAEGTLSISLVWEAVQTDGCTWQSQQTLSGELRLDDKARKPLAWTYAEHVVDGDPCGGACRGSAEVRIENTSRGKGGVDEAIMDLSKP